MTDFIERHFISLAGIGGVVLIALLIWAGIVDDQKWREFAAQHHCLAVGEKEATNGLGTAVGPNGQVSTVVTYNPSQTIYRCDGGMIHIR